MTEITDEQRAAWLSLVHDLDDFEQSKQELALIAPLLPSELTNPQSVLPTEPGAYLSPTNVTIVLTEDGDWMHGDNPMATATVRAMLSLIPLVPERPQITRGQIESVIRAWVGSPGGAAAAIFDLVSGNDQ